MERTLEAGAGAPVRRPDARGSAATGTTPLLARPQHPAPRRHPAHLAHPARLSHPSPSSPKRVPPTTAPLPRRRPVIGRNTAKKSNASVRLAEQAAAAVKIVVFGAGVFGSWCAWFLSEAGHHVTLIEHTDRRIHAPVQPTIRASSAAATAPTRSTRNGRARPSMTGAGWRTRRDATCWRRPARCSWARQADVYVKATHGTLSALGIRVELLQPEAIRQALPANLNRRVGRVGLRA